jgi:formiminotetrahydrofolate cyclodeaminase
MKNQKRIMNGTTMAEVKTVEMATEEQARREFLKNAGRFAVVTPPSIALLLGTSLNSPAIAASHGVRPGNGFGDKNHLHFGPPGKLG